MASPHDEHPHEHPELERAGGAVPGEPTDAQPEARQTDLLSLALLVFFVALIAVVGALLLVPALF
jgi:hypothetical protein